MKESEIKEYQATIEPWKPGKNVTTMEITNKELIIALDIIDSCVDIANKAIEDIIK